MAHMVPEVMLEFDPKSREDVIFKALQKGLDSSYWVFYSCQVNQTSANGAFHEKEIDFVVYHREKGILCIEAKNGHGISYSGGRWLYSSGNPMAHGGPFKQALLERITICNLLRKRAEETEVVLNDSHFREIGARCKVVWGVWFHGMSRADVDALALPPDAPRDRILTLDDLRRPNVRDAIDRLFDVDVAAGVQTALDDADDKWIVCSVLAPEITGLVPSARATCDFNDLVCRQLTQEQARVLDFLEGQKSAVINGMAGTGKTFVALERARRCAARGERVLYLCFNLALKSTLEAQFVATDAALKPQVDFMTLDEFTATLSGPLPPTEELKTLGHEGIRDLQLRRYTTAAEALFDRMGGFAYTQVVVDEGQDCAIDFIEESGLMETLRDIVTMQPNETGCPSAFFMFYDALQLVSLRAGATAELPRVIRDSDCKLTLYKNCRNTSAIAQSAARGVLAHGRSPEMAAGALLGTKPEVAFVAPEVSADELAARVSKRLADLRKLLPAKDIVVISCAPGGTGTSRLERKLSVKDNGETFLNQVYRFTTYRKFKGLDAAAVVLVDVDRSAFLGTHGAMPFYEAASRARQKLVVFASLSTADCSDILAAFAGREIEGMDSPEARFAAQFQLEPRIP